MDAIADVPTDSPVSNSGTVSHDFTHLPAPVPLALTFRPDRFGTEEQNSKLLVSVERAGRSTEPLRETASPGVALEQEEPDPEFLEFQLSVRRAQLHERRLVLERFLNERTTI